MIRSALFAGLVLFALPALAEPVTYTPDGCEFALDLPETPQAAQGCDTAAPEKCAKLAKFSKFFADGVSISMVMSCNPVDEKMFAQYSTDVMKTTLIAMLKREEIDNFETGYSEFKEAKQAILIATGTENGNEKIYTSQLWVGHKSLLVIEATLAGGPLPEADAMYAGILKSIRHVDWPANTAAPQQKPAEKAAEKP